MTDDELLEKLKVFKEKLSNAQLRRAGLMARIEGLNTELLVNGLVLERVETMLAEMLEAVSRLQALEQEKDELSRWSIENLPSEFHLTFDE